MLAVIKAKPSPGVELKDIPIPKPKVDEVLVLVRGASICGTDIGIYDWIPWAASHITPPIIIGHEVVGEVVEINSNKSHNLKKGDLVSSETHIFCGSCYQCKIGNKHVCEKMQLFGISRDGAFAKYCTIPLKTTWKNDPSLDPDVMSVQEPLGNAVHAVAKASVRSKKVLIMGLGPTGLCAGGVARAFEAKQIVGVNDDEYRRKLASKTGWFSKVLPKLSPKEFNSFDVVLEMSGSTKAIQVAFDAVRIAGKIVAFGIPKSDVCLNWGKYMINKELTIESVFGRKIWETWEQTTNLLKSGKIDLKKIITHTFPLSEFEEAMRVMKSKQCGKVVLIP